MELKYKTIKKFISDVKVQEYAEVSGDFNPIHLDDNYAKKTDFKNKIAHGMLLISNINELMIKNFNSSWNKSGALKIKFRNPLILNSKLITKGKIKKIDKNNDGTLYTCEVMCKDEDDNILINGIASVLVQE